MADQYEKMMQKSRQLARKMCGILSYVDGGTRAAFLLTAEYAHTHHMDVN